MTRLFSLSVIATLALSTTAQASKATDIKDKIPVNCLTSKVCLEQIKDKISDKITCFDWDVIFPGFDFCTGKDCDKSETTPDIKPPQEDVQKPDTSLPQEPSEPGDDQIGEEDTITPPSKPETDIPQTDVEIPEAESSLNKYEKEVVKLVNEIRSQNGLAGLEIDEELSRVARIKSQDMKDNNYFSHTSPTYGSPFDMMQKFGISYRSAGENIAKGQSSAQEVVNAWMNSEGHRKNILSSSFTAIGVGYVSQGNYWTQMFVGR